MSLREPNYCVRCGLDKIRLDAEGICEDCRWEEMENVVPIDVSYRDDTPRYDTPPPRHPLMLRPIAEIVAELNKAGPREWDVERVIVHGQHGVDGSTSKAGKGFDVADFCVSIASGTPWLDHFPCPNPGPVALWPGEEDDHELWRRIVAVAETRGLNALELPIHIAENTPRLGRRDELKTFREQVQAIRPRLSIVDPMYKAAAGADTRSVVAMGEMLSEASDIAREFDSSFLTVPHFNRDTSRKGADRFSGAGAQEWGRFLIAGTVTKRSRTPEGGTEIVRRLDVTGTSIPDRSFTVSRRVWAVTQNDPDSALVYEVEVTEIGEDVTPPELDYSLTRVLELLSDSRQTRTVKELQDLMKANDPENKPYARSTLSTKLNELAELGYADCLGEDGIEKRWWRTDHDA